MVKSRSAFTLIELIFAIVVIGLTVIALPTISRVLSKSAESNIIQEAVFAAATELNEATTAHWDENSTDANSTATLAMVINLDSNCEDDNTNPRYRLRPGHILQPLHRKCLNDLTVTDGHTAIKDDVIAVEDMLHSSQEIFINPTPSAQGYKNDYNSSVTVSYSPSFAGTTQPNMKKITAKIIDADGNTIVQLSTYVANIGEVDYYKRTF